MRPDRPPVHVQPFVLLVPVLDAQVSHVAPQLDLVVVVVARLAGAGAFVVVAVGARVVVERPVGVGAREGRVVQPQRSAAEAVAVAALHVGEAVVLHQRVVAIRAARVAGVVVQRDLAGRRVDEVLVEAAQVGHGVAQLEVVVDRAGGGLVPRQQPVLERARVGAAEAHVVALQRRVARRRGEGGSRARALRDAQRQPPLLADERAFLPGQATGNVRLQSDQRQGLLTSNSSNQSSRPCSARNKTRPSRPRKRLIALYERRFNHSTFSTSTSFTCGGRNQSRSLIC